MIYQTMEASATTIWELWDAPSEGPGMNSRNHIMFGSVGSWFYSSLGGINQPQPSLLEYSNGFQSIIISPPPASVLLYSTLSSVSSSMNLGAAGVDVIVSNWVKMGGTLCGMAPENSVMSFTCGGDGIIQKVLFASFGTPYGECGGFSDNSTCNAQSTVDIVNNLCIGQPSCSINVDDTTFGDPCYGTVKRMYAEVFCSNPETYFLNVQIPANTNGEIHVSKLAFSDLEIQESGVTVWQQQNYVAGEAGIIEGYDDGNGEIVFETGSGDYTFQVTGNPGVSVCASVAEHQTLDLSCPSGYLIATVPFASFGNTSDDGCDTTTYGACHAGSSRYTVEQSCLGMNSCSVLAEDWIFGEPCFGTFKTLKAQVICTTNS